MAGHGCIKPIPYPPPQLSWSPFASVAPIPLTLAWPCIAMHGRHISYPSPQARLVSWVNGGIGAPPLPRPAPLHHQRSISKVPLISLFIVFIIIRTRSPRSSGSVPIPSISYAMKPKDQSPPSLEDPQPQAPSPQPLLPRRSRQPESDWGSMESRSM